MRRPDQIEKESAEIGTVKELTGVFESISSTQVAKVKSKVELSRQFFQLLWKRYSAIRVDPNQLITNRGQITKSTKKVFVLISAEAGLSGDIDQRLIETMLKNYDKETTDIIVLGTHGATMLKERGIPFVKYFQVPESESYIDVTPVVDALKNYSKILVYYEEYVSLGTQDIKEIDLVSNIKDMAENAEVEDIISTDETIFEPSIEVIAAEMEQTMMRIALSQTIMESGLAQAASRFNAMAVAKRRAVELILAFKLEFHRSKRYQGDRRTREVRVGIKNRKKHMRSRQ